METRENTGTLERGTGIWGRVWKQEWEWRFGTGRIRTRDEHEAQELGMRNGRGIGCGQAIGRGMIDNRN